MKVNIPVRMKNPWFWVGVGSVAITAIGVDPQTFTSWSAVWMGIKGVLSNPVQLCTMCLAVLSVFIDPTTAGVSDSEKALTYDAPRKDSHED
jgi:phi LC3 family holin